jgi:hypothetical protein
MDEAREAIERTLSRSPDHSGALALRNVMGVMVNDRVSALQDSRRAVELEPRSAAARIALSYALQADLQHEAARATLEEVTVHFPLRRMQPVDSPMIFKGLAWRLAK